MSSKAEYEKHIQSFVNETLSKVIYLDGASDERMPFYIYYEKPFHNVMWGVEFQFASKRKFTLWWGYDFNFGEAGVYSLDIIDNTGWEDDSTSEYPTQWNVSSTDEWKKVIGKRIAKITVFWDSFCPNIPYYPQDVAITFDTGDTYIVSLAMYQDDRFYFGADEVTLFFDKATAQQYGLPSLPK